MRVGVIIVAMILFTGNIANAVSADTDLSVVVECGNNLFEWFKSLQQPNGYGRGIYTIVNTNELGEVRFSVSDEGRRVMAEIKHEGVRKTYLYYGKVFSMYIERDERKRCGQRLLFHPNGRLKQEIHMEGGHYIGSIKEYSEDGTLVSEKNVHGKRIPTVTPPSKAGEGKQVKTDTRKVEFSPTDTDVNHLELAKPVVMRSRQLLQEVVSAKESSTQIAWKDDLGWFCFTNTAGNVVADSGVSSNKKTQTITERKGDLIMSYIYRQGRLRTFVRMSTNDYSGVVYSFYETGRLRSSACVGDKKYKGNYLLYDENGKVKTSRNLRGALFLVDEK